MRALDSERSRAPHNLCDVRVNFKYDVGQTVAERVSVAHAKVTASASTVTFSTPWIGLLLNDDRRSLQSTQNERRIPRRYTFVEGSFSNEMPLSAYSDDERDQQRWIGKGPGYREGRLS